MTCKKCQGKILDALAAGASHVAPEVAAHQQSCPACTQFFATQQSLFQSIDARLQCLVNSPVPVSLLPGIRSRLDENPAEHRRRLLAWNLAAVAALAIAGVILGHFWRRPAVLPNSLEQPTIASQAGRVPQEVPQDARQLNPRSRYTVPVRARHKTPPPASPATPEVIVLAEEREAFAKFVAEVPQQPQVAVAFTRPTPATPDAPIEIALLHIDRLEVNLLNPVASQ